MATLDITKVKEHKTTEPTLTPYGVWKLVDKALKTEDLDTIPSQMVYTYVQNKLIPAVKVLKEGGDWQVRVTRSDADKWVTKYVGRRLEKAQTA